LNWLSSQLGEEVIDRMIITTGREAYRRTDGVAVVPAALLGPGVETARRGAPRYWPT
jgi:uncharacterized protein